MQDYLFIYFLRMFSHVRKNLNIYLFLAGCSWLPGRLGRYSRGGLSKPDEESVRAGLLQARAYFARAVVDY